MVYDDTGTAYIKRGEGDLENYPAASSNRGGGNKDLTDHSPLKPIFFYRKSTGNHWST